MAATLATLNFGSAKSLTTRTFTTAEGLAHDHVTSVYHDSHGFLWMCTVNGLSRFDGEVFTNYDVRDGLPVPVVHDIVEVDDGYYVCLWGGGVVRYNPATSDEQLFSPIEGEYAQSCRVLRPDGPDRVWMATAGGLYVIDTKNPTNTVKPVIFEDPLKFPADVPVWDVLIDRSGVLWVATAKGLLSRTPSGIENVHYVVPEGVPGDNVLGLLEDSHRDVWICIQAEPEDALVRWDRKSESLHIVTLPTDLSSSNPSGIMVEDNSGALWVGLRKRVGRFRDGKLTSWGREHGLTADSNVSLFLGSQGQLWILSSNLGVNLLTDPAAENPTFSAFDSADQLPSSSVICATDDQWGRIYLGTTNGLLRVDPLDGQTRHFTTADGMSNIEVADAKRDRNGDLWLTSVRGVSRLSPLRDERKISPSPVRITGLRVGGERYLFSELGEVEVSGIRLEPWRNQVEIDFACLGFPIGVIHQYQYKLEGADDDWGHKTSRRSVDFAQLRSGHYRFLVRGVTPDGVTSVSPASVSLQILPPIWLRWWFLGLSASFIVSTAYATHRFRLDRFVQLERVRTRIATDLHDDLGSSLSRIAILSEIARREFRDPSSNAPQLMGEIAQTARELVQATSDIVWAINPRQDDLGSLVARIRCFASDVFDGCGVEWDFETPPEPWKIRLDPGARRHLFLLIKEAITNITKHAAASHVMMLIRIESNVIVAEIEDDGRGFDLKIGRESGAEIQGHGLTNMKVRAEAAGGRFHVDSTPGIGTRIRVTIPVRSAG